MPKHTTRRRRQLSDADREQRRAEQRQLVTASIEQLRRSVGWQAYLRARRRLHAYSPRNVLLIMLQRPTAESVAGFQAWLKLGYCVRAGERSIKIWAPCPPSKRQLRAWRDAGADPDKRPRTRWRLASVFDRLSRVRSGGCRRRPSREIRCLPVSCLCCSSAPASRRRGGVWPARSSRSRRPRATAQRRSRAPLAGTPGNRSVLTRCRECRHPCPHTGNLADRRQVSEGCRLAPTRATPSRSPTWPLLSDSSRFSPGYQPHADGSFGCGSAAQLAGWLVGAFHAGATMRLSDR
jgi:hypothetical protein